MKKILFKLLFVIIITYSGCSNELTTSDLKLQGEWVLAKDPIIDEIAVVYLKINFDKNKFGLQRIYKTDEVKRGEGEFYIEGDFKSDENFIYLIGIYEKEINLIEDDDYVKKQYNSLDREFKKNLKRI